MARTRVTRLPRDPQGRHIRVYATLLDGVAFRVLGRAAKALFIDLRAKVNGSNNGNIEATLTTLKHKGWTSPTTLATALYELRALGFIVQTRGGGVEHGSRVCSLYRFTDLGVFEHPKLAVPESPATHDYARFTTVSEARSALEAGVQELRAAAIERKQTATGRKKTTLQNLDPTAPKSGPEGGVPRSKNWSKGLDTDPNTGAEKMTEKDRKPARSNDFSQIATEHESEPVCSKNWTPLYGSHPIQHVGGVSDGVVSAPGRPRKACGQWLKWHCRIGANRTRGPGVTRCQIWRKMPRYRSAPSATQRQSKPTEPRPSRPRCAKAPTCQHAGCRTLTLKREFCAKHRPLGSARNDGRSGAAVH